MLVEVHIGSVSFAAQAIDCAECASLSMTSHPITGITGASSLCGIQVARRCWFLLANAVKANNILDAVR